MARTARIEDRLNFACCERAAEEFDFIDQSAKGTAARGTDKQWRVDILDCARRCGPVADLHAINIDTHKLPVVCSGNVVKLVVPNGCAVGQGRADELAVRQTYPKSDAALLIEQTVDAVSFTHDGSKFARRLAYPRINSDGGGTLCGSVGHRHNAS